MLRLFTLLQKFFLDKTSEIQFFKSSKLGFQCQKLIFLQNKCQIRNQHKRLCLDISSYLPNSENNSFEISSTQCPVTQTSCIAVLYRYYKCLPVRNLCKCTPPNIYTTRQCVLELRRITGPAKFSSPDAQYFRPSQIARHLTSSCVDSQMNVIAEFYGIYSPQSSADQ